jgi:tetratricopeptide (TPR) repeat protein
MTLSGTLYDRGRFAEAQAGWEENLAVFREQGRREYEINMMVCIGRSSRHQGGYGKARAWIEKALLLSCESESWHNSLECYMELGRLALAEAAYDKAGKWLHQGLPNYERFGQHWLLSELRSTFAYLACKQEHLTQAREYLRGAVQIAVESRQRNAALQSLLAMALLLLDGGETERAVELYALASRYPYVANSRWFEDVAGREITAAAEALPPDVVARAQERGRARDLWAAVEELLDELGGSPSD